MGDPDFAYGFSRYLQVMLRQRFPSMKFEIVNAGMVAINSHVILEMARQFADYKPDLFLVYAGSNEVVGPYGPGTVLTGSSMNPACDSRQYFCAFHAHRTIADRVRQNAHRMARHGNVPG